MECYLITGDAHYLLRAVAPEIQALERFIVVKPLVEAILLHQSPI